MRVFNAWRLAGAFLMVPAFVAAQPLTLTGKDPESPARTSTPVPVSLGGVMGRKALLSIHGSPPRAVAVGETRDGVTVLAVERDQAQVEISGERRWLKVGEIPIGVAHSNTSESPAGQRIVLQAGRGGHYFASGQINGHYAQFVVDTGATSVAMSASQADAFGIAYKSGRMARASTANGVTIVYVVMLDTVRIGSVTLRNVEASVGQASMPYILLGNTFLSRFEIHQNGAQMTLQKRY